MNWPPTKSQAVPLLTREKLPPDVDASAAAAAMPPTTIPPAAAAAVRGVLSTPLEAALSELTELAPPTHHRATSSGPGGARFVGGHAGVPQRVITLDHNLTVADALEKIARHRILGAPVVIQPDLLDADSIHHERLVGGAEEEEDVESPTLLGFFDVGDALRCLVSELPEEDRDPSGEPPHRNVLRWMKVLEQVEKRVVSKRLISVLGDDAELMYRPNAATHSLLDAVSEGFLSKKSANGFVHRLAIFDTRGQIVRQGGDVRDKNPE